MTIRGIYGLQQGDVRAIWTPGGDDGGGVVTPPTVGIFTASPSFDPLNPAWRDGTPVTGDARTAWDRFYYRINKFNTAYSSTELDLTQDPFKVAANQGWGSYEAGRAGRNWGSLLLQVLAPIPWEGIPLMAAEFATRWLASRQSAWTPDPGFSNPYPDWTQTSYPFWAWWGPDVPYRGTDLNPLDESGVHVTLSVWARMLWENRHIPVCASAAQALFAHYRDYQIPKWVARMAARGFGAYNYNKTTIPLIHPKSSHTMAGYMLELLLMEPVARDLDAAWAASKYDNLERGFDTLFNDYFTVRYGSTYMGVSGRVGGMHTVDHADGVAYVWAGGQMLDAASDILGGAARTNQYTSYTLNHFSLMALLRPDVVTDTIMQRLARTAKHRYWRVPASSITSFSSQFYTWGDHAFAYKDTDGTVRAGTPIVTKEGQTIPVGDPNHRTPPHPGHNTTHPFHMIAAWDADLLPYLDALTNVFGANVAQPRYFTNAGEKLIALGRPYIGAS